MFWRRYYLIFIGLTAFILSNCSVLKTPQINSQKFEQFNGKIILCFDLSDDLDTPVGNLLLNFDSSTTNQKSIVIPFSTQDIETSRKILATSGVYDDKFTLINTLMGNSSIGVHNIPFLPKIESLSVDKPNLPGINKPGVYFYKNGLERWFVFIDNTEKIQEELKSNFPEIDFTSFDSIAVSMPPGTEGRDIEQRTSIIPRTYETNETEVFFSSSSYQQENKIALRYDLPATPAQIAASNNLVKFFSIFFIPALSLIFIDPDDIEKPKLRNILIGVFILFQLILCLLLIWLGVTYRNFSLEAQIDFGLAALGVIGEGGIILVKAKKVKKVNSSTNGDKN